MKKSRRKTGRDEQENSETQGLACLCLKSFTAAERERGAKAFSTKLACGWLPNSL